MSINIFLARLKLEIDTYGVAFLVRSLCSFEMNSLLLSLLWTTDGTRGIFYRMRTVIDQDHMLRKLQTQTTAEQTRAGGCAMCASAKKDDDMIKE